MCKICGYWAWCMGASCAPHVRALGSTASMRRRRRRCRQAIKARQALIKSAKWTLGPELPDPAKIYDVLLALPTEDIVISDKQASMPEGTKVIEATYRKPYMAHASIGPSCALAEFKDGKMTVWTHSQGVFPLRNHLSLGLKLLVADIRCIHAEGSGCYGHKAPTTS